MHLRDSVFLGLEKISNERPIFGKGVEIAPLWKQCNDDKRIILKDAGKHHHIRKYEHLLRQKQAISEQGT